MALVIFDLDDTLIHGDCATLWSEQMGRLGWVDPESFMRKNHELMGAYSQGKLSPEIANAANAALVDPVNRWLDLIVEQLPARTAEASLPHQIYLAGEAARLPAVLLGARRYSWMQNLQWSRHPEIGLWQPSGVSDLKNHSTRVWNASDMVRLGLARLILDIR